MSQYGSAPAPNDMHSAQGYGSSNSGITDFAHGNPSSMSSPLSQSMGQQQHLYDDYASSQPGSSVAGYDQQATGINRSASTASTAVQGGSAPSRSNTLKKKASVRRTGSLKRSSSRKSLKAGSIKGMGGVDSDQDFNSALYTPIPTQGTPTEVLANRFQAWRQLLKSLITYFREIQSSYDARAKAVHKVQSTIAGITNPAMFMTDHGLGDATRILDDYHKHSVAEANKSKEIENDVIGALTGLRSDIGQKIKEIKSLSGDFKNTVEKEKEVTRREVDKLQEALQHADHEDGSATGKNDPFVVRLGVDRAIEKQIDEENYLHRAYLNLEASGRELESIVVGEIQKAYNALAGILRREADDAYHVVDTLRNGPISMPKDQEWSHFVDHDPHFVSPDLPLRRIEDIQYPGKNHPAATEIRAGMLERKSKYLKSYTPGWYVLSPTHLHEFKSADKIYTQPPVMSLYLGDQRLGSHSEAGSSSNKFMLKGRQAGGMHKGHSWVFRAESYDTMLAWFNDIQILTEKSGPERDAFVRKHARSVSGNSERPRSMSSDGMEEDEADYVPYSADTASLAEQHPVEEKPRRPQPGGRFPSDLQLSRNAQLSPSSNSSPEPDRHETAFVGAAALAPAMAQEYQRSGTDPYHLEGVRSGSRQVSAETAGPPASYDDDQQRYMPGAGSVQEQQQQRYMSGANPAQEQQRYISNVNPVQEQQQPEPVKAQSFALPLQQARNERVPISQQQMPTQTQQQDPFLGSEPMQPVAVAQPGPSAQTQAPQSPLQRQSSTYGDWMKPTAEVATGAGMGAFGAEAYRNRKNEERVSPIEDARETEEIPRRANPGGLSSAQFWRPENNAGQRDQTAAMPEPAPVSQGPSTTASAIPVPTSSLAGHASQRPETATSTFPSSAQASSDIAPTTGLGSGGALGGLEKEGLRETREPFPFVRHDTDMSISKLHVPGEYPKRA